MKCICLKDGIYVIVDIGYLRKVSVGKVIISDAHTRALLYGGRVYLDYDKKSTNEINIKIDGINICTPGGGIYLNMPRVVSHLNAIATNGVDAFLMNYKKALEQYYNDLKDLRQEISLGISSTESSSNSELMEQLKSIMEKMTFIVSILFTLNIWMPAALDNQKVIDITEAIYESCSQN